MVVARGARVYDLIPAVDQPAKYKNLVVDVSSDGESDTSTRPKSQLSHLMSGKQEVMASKALAGPTCPLTTSTSSTEKEDEISYARKNGLSPSPSPTKGAEQDNGETIEAGIGCEQSTLKSVLSDASKDATYKHNERLLGLLRQMSMVLDKVHGTVRAGDPQPTKKKPKKTISHSGAITAGPVMCDVAIGMHLTPQLLGE